MFVACWRWSLDEDAWVTTNGSVNLDLVERLETEEHVGPRGSRWGVKAIAGRHTYDLATGAPDRDYCLQLVALMCEQTGVGRWPLIEPTPTGKLRTVTGADDPGRN